MRKNARKKKFKNADKRYVEHSGTHSLYLG